MRRKIEVIIETTKRVEDLHEIVREALEEAPYVEEVLSVEDSD